MHFQGENEQSQCFSISFVCRKGKWKHRPRQQSLCRSEALSTNSSTEVSKVMKCQRGSTGGPRNPLLKLFRVRVWNNFLVSGITNSHFSDMLIIKVIKIILKLYLLLLSPKSHQRTVLVNLLLNVCLVNLKN